jgi:hypothetical protein
VHLGVVLVHPHKKFELNWSKNDRVMADFRPKITFFYRSLYIQLVRSSSFFCGAVVGLWAFPQGISAHSDDGNGGKMGIFQDLALDLANFNLYSKILLFNRSLYIEYRPIELIFLVELY